MATPGGYWRPRDPNRPMVAPTLATPSQPSPAALGIPSVAPPPTETPEQRAARTGVNVGGGGAVSGQVAPGQGTSALAALGGVTGAAPAPGSPGAAVGGFAQGGVRPNVGTPGVGTVNPGGPTGQTIQTPYGALPIPQGDTATQTSALTAPGGGNTGTTPGYSPVPKPVQNAIGQVPVIGPAINSLTTSSAVDLTPGLAAQRAAFGISDDLDQERFDYRPGDAPSMNIDSDIRQGQKVALGGLRDAATGAVPSAAELQMRREAGRNVAATLGQARALGARSAGGAARAGTLASADILARSSMDGAQLRAQEQAQARAAEVAALSGVRGQDTDISGANLRSQLETNQLAEAHRMKLLEARLQALGIGSSTIASILGAAKANADSENKMKGGIIGGIAGKLGL
jgi:hypothetical protein